MRLSGARKGVRCGRGLGRPPLLNGCEVRNAVLDRSMMSMKLRKKRPHKIVTAAKA